MKKKKEVITEEVVEDVVEDVVEEVTEEVVEDVVEEVTEEVVEDVVEEVVENVTEEVVEKPITGVVIAAKLNVRALPSKDSNVITVLNEGDVVIIDNSEEAAYEEFFKIITCDGLECYCMKKFIKLN